MRFAKGLTYGGAERLAQNRDLAAMAAKHNREHPMRCRVASPAERDKLERATKVVMHIDRGVGKSQTAVIVKNRYHALERPIKSTAETEVVPFMLAECVRWPGGTVPIRGVVARNMRSAIAREAARGPDCPACLSQAAKLRAVAKDDPMCPRYRPVAVKPCDKCGSTDILIHDVSNAPCLVPGRTSELGEQQVVMAYGGTCRNCGHSHWQARGERLSQTEAVRIWNDRKLPPATDGQVKAAVLAVLKVRLPKLDEKQREKVTDDVAWGIDHRGSASIDWLTVAESRRISRICARSWAKMTKKQQAELRSILKPLLPSKQKGAKK